MIGSRLRVAIDRRRGRITAVALVASILGILSLIDRERPRARWVESIGSRQDSRSPTIETILFSPDGRSILIQDVNPPRIRDLETGEVRWLYLNEAKYGRRYHPLIASFDWMEGGRLLAGLVSTNDRTRVVAGSVHVWDVATGRERFVDPEANPLDSLLISDNGSAIAYRKTLDNLPRLAVWREEMGDEAREFEGSGLVAISANGRFLATGHEREIIVHEVRSAEKVGAILLPPGDLDLVDSLAVSPDGQMVGDSRNLTIRLHDLATSIETLRFEVPTRSVPRFSLDGSLLRAGRPNRDDGYVEVWAVSNDPPTLLFQGESEGSNRDGHFLIQKDDRLNEFSRVLEIAPRTDPISNQQQLTILERPVFQKGRGTTVRSLDGSNLAYLSNETHPSWLWKMTARLPMGYRPSNPGWRLIQSIEVIDARTGQGLKTVRLAESTILNKMTLADEGKRVIISRSPMMSGVGSKEVTVEVWDVRRSSRTWLKIVGIVVPLVLVLGWGGWYDRRARRRALLNPSSALA